MSDDQLAVHVHAQLAEAHRLLSLGDKAESLDVLRQMLSLKATGTFWGGVAQQLYHLSDLQGAEKAARKYQSSCPGDARATLMLAMILGDAGKLREALPLATKAAKARADDAAAQYGVGLLLARDNKLDSALKRFRRAVALQADYVEALEYIAYLGIGEPEPGDFQAIDNAFARKRHAGQPGEAALWYARATLLERAGDFENAFNAFETGARLMQVLNTIDLESMERYVERLKASFSNEFFADNERHRYSNKLPVFIVGVPRSGTTLVETALAAHSKVSSAGESTLLSLATMDYGSFEPVDLERLESEINHGQKPWSNMGLTLKKAYADRVGRGRRVTEKNLGHHFLLGAIAMIASGAPIIYCVRDPAATAWSCFKTRFLSGNEWSYDFESIVRYQRLYSDLMNHWQASLPGDPILEVRYEDLVSRPGEIIPEIVSHAGLKLEPGCLSPHRARTPVMTASMAQVRQPIHTGAVTGWKRYEPWLAERHEVFRITEGTLE